MPNQIEFLASTDVELMALVRALQTVRPQYPFCLLGLKWQAGVCLVQLESAVCLALYAAVQQERQAQTGAMCVSDLASSPSPLPPPLIGADRLSRCLAQAPRTFFTSSFENRALVQGQDYQRQDLRGRSFAHTDLRGANFNDADLRAADFTGANLEGASLQRVRIGHADEHSFDAKARVAAWLLFQGHGLAVLVTALWLPVAFFLAFGLTCLPWPSGLGRSLFLLWLVFLLLPSLHWGLPSLRTGLLKWLANGGTRFCAANLRTSNFSGARIGLSNFHAAFLHNNHWRGAQWQAPLFWEESRLLSPKLQALLTQLGDAGRDFSEMDLSGLDFSGLDLSHFDFHGSNFSGANLQGAILTGADLSLCTMDAATNINQVNCAYWCASELPGGRWPPLPETLLTAEFEQRRMIFPPGIVFLAHGWASLQVWLDAILLLQPSLAIWVREIAVEYSLLADCEPVFRIEVQLATCLNYEAVCDQVWRQTQLLVSAPSQLPARSERLFTLFQDLAA